MTEESQDGEFVRNLMMRLRDGSHGAAVDVFGRMQPRLLAVLRKWLAESPARGRVEAEDVAQSVLATFWSRMRDGRLTPSGFEEWNDVWNALVLIARRRLIRRQREMFAEKRGGGRNDLPLFSEDGSVIDGPSTQPEAVDLLICNEILELLLSEVDEACQATVLLAIDGYSKVEIAELTSVTTRSVNRRLEFVRATLTSMMREDEAFDEPPGK